MSKYMLTTKDNPFNPFEDFREWFVFDIQKGYNSCGLLARCTRTTEAMSEQENDEEIERAIDEIIKYDFRKIYEKVSKSSYKEKNSKKTTKNKEN